jgi:uncharacterized membrane protein
MNLYSTVVFLHVITALFGLGPLIVLALASSGPETSWMPQAPFVRLLRLTGWSLAAMFVTGALLIALTRGALGQTGWMRVSFGLFLLLGFLQGMTRRQLRKAYPNPTLRPFLWAMCAVVAAITYLMEAKPW